MKRLIPSYGAKIYDDRRRKEYEDDMDGEFKELEPPTTLLDLESQLPNPYNPNTDDPEKPQTPRMSYAELQAENNFPKPTKEALAYVSNNASANNRLIPTFDFQPANLKPSSSSQLINDATTLDDNHFVAFANFELERMKSEVREEWKREERESEKCRRRNFRVQHDPSF